MYSVVMMVMMSQTPDIASFGGRGCRGGSGCGGYSGSCWGGNGCRGGGHGCRGGIFGGRRGGCRGYDNCGCHGGWGYGCSGYNACGCTGGYGGYSGGCWGGQMAAPVMQAAPAAAPAKGAMVPAPAMLVVNLPADAKLAFDGIATTSTTNVRRFVTPTLNSGIDHTYTLSAEIVRDGKTLNSKQVVTVRAGETTEVNFGEATFATTVAKN